MSPQVESLILRVGQRWAKDLPLADADADEVIALLEQVMDLREGLRLYRAWAGAPATYRTAPSVSPAEYECAKWECEHRHLVDSGAAGDP